MTRPPAPARPVPCGTLVVATRWSGHPPSDRFLGTAERHYARQLPSWRRREWTAGRLTVRATVRLALGEVPVGLEVLPAHDGAPQPRWPGIGDRVLSLAHCDVWTVCALGPGGVPLGVDVEEAGACDQALLARVRGPDEVPVAGEPATLGWARKEAAFKACRGSPPLLSHYHLTGRRHVVAASAHTPSMTLLTWSRTLPGAVLAVAGLHHDAPRLRVLHAAAVIAILRATRTG